MSEASGFFVSEVQEHQMTPIEILNWYRNFYRTENNNTEQGIMVRAINDIFKRLVETGASCDEKLTIMSNEDYARLKSTKDVSEKRVSNE